MFTLPNSDFSFLNIILYMEMGQKKMVDTLRQVRHQHFGVGKTEKWEIKHLVLKCFLVDFCF